MITLFIGRFQPFHLGHLSALKDIDNEKDTDEIIIGVGSSQYSNTEDNPYDLEERKVMIEDALKNKIKKPYKLIAIPDIHDDKRWVHHVEKIVGNFDIIYTGNDWVKKLFIEKGYEVRPVNFKIKISGTKLREMMKNDDNQWKKFIP